MVEVAVEMDMQEESKLQCAVTPRPQLGITLYPSQSL